MLEHFPLNHPTTENGSLMKIHSHDRARYADWHELVWDRIMTPFFAFPCCSFRSKVKMASLMETLRPSAQVVTKRHSGESLGINYPKFKLVASLSARAIGKTGNFGVYTVNLTRLSRTLSKHPAVDKLREECSPSLPCRTELLPFRTVVINCRSYISTEMGRIVVAITTTVVDWCLTCDQRTDEMTIQAK